jgi:hypothetical protein
MVLQVCIVTNILPCTAVMLLLLLLPQVLELPDQQVK